MGIEVHYLFFPRTGPNTESWTKADHVWCAADHNTALTKAKLGGEVPDATCGNTPVESHWSLGKRIGVRGTPAVFSESGRIARGYSAARDARESPRRIGGRRASAVVFALVALTDGVDQLTGSVGGARDAHAPRDRPRRRQHHIHQHPGSAAARAPAAARSRGRARACDGHANPVAARTHLDHAAPGDARPRRAARKRVTLRRGLRRKAGAAKSTPRIPEVRGYAGRELTMLPSGSLTVIPATTGAGPARRPGPPGCRAAGGWRRRRPVRIAVATAARVHAGAAHDADPGRHAERRAAGQDRLVPLGGRRG